MEQKSLGNIVLVRATHQATMTGPEIRHVFGSRGLPYVWSNYFWLSLRRFSLILTKKKTFAHSGTQILYQFHMICFQTEICLDPVCLMSNQVSKNSKNISILQNTEIKPATLQATMENMWKCALSGKHIKNPLWCFNTSWLPGKKHYSHTPFYSSRIVRKTHEITEKCIKSQKYWILRFPLLPELGSCVAGVPSKKILHWAIQLLDPQAVFPPGN